MAVSKVTAPSFVARKRCKGAHKLSSPCAPARTKRYLLSSGHFPDRCVFYAGETAQTAQAIVGILLWAPASTPQALRVTRTLGIGIWCVTRGIFDRYSSVHNFYTVLFE